MATAILAAFPPENGGLFALPEKFFNPAGAIAQRPVAHANDRQIGASPGGVIPYPSTIEGVTSRLSHAIQRIDDLISRGGSAIAIDSTLEDLCDIKKGTFPTMKTPPGDFPFVVLAADKRTADNYQFDGEAVCIPLVSSTGHGHAAIHRLHYASGQFAVANILAAVMVKPQVPLLTKYLFYYLWRFKEEKLVKLMAGTANTSLTIEKLNEVKVQAPDEAEQLDIVQAIEAAFEELAAVRQLLRSTNEILDDATTDVLRASFSK